MCIRDRALTEETIEDGSRRILLKIPPVLAPTKLAIFPLVKKDGLPEIAKRIVKDLKLNFTIAYDEKDAVGRRYRRQDALGTPYCVTIDHQTLEDETITIRDRDSMTQDRVPIKSLMGFLQPKLSLSELLKKL